jgi:two-component system chemotaxis response regulator CheY
MTPSDGDLPFHVMIIDDQKSMRKIVRSLLNEGRIYEITEAESGQQAIEILNSPAQTPPDVIISDLYMDKMDGLEFVNHIRRDLAKTYRTTPVILLTGEKDTFIHDVAKQVGAVNVLTKPISSEKLVKEIKAAIGFAG